MRARLIRNLFCILVLLLEMPAHSQPDQDRVNFWNALQAAKDDSTRALALLDYGGLFEYTNYDSAEFYYREALRLSLSSGFVRGIQKYISYQSVIYSLKGLLDSSLMISRWGLELAREHKNELFFGTHHNNIANYYQHKGNNDSAAWYYLAGTKNFEAIRDSFRMGITYSNLAGIFANLRQYRQSLYYNFLALEIANATGDKAGVGYAMNNIGATYKKIGMPDSARPFLEKALPIAIQTGDLNLEKDVTVNLGFVELDKNNDKLAREYFIRSLSISNSLSNEYGAVFSNKGLATLELKKKNYHGADRLLKAAIEIASGNNAFREELQNLHLLKYEAALGLGDHKSALASYQKHISLKDSIMNSEIQKNVASLEKQYQTERKERLLLQKDLQINKQTTLLKTKNIWIIILAGVMILLGIIALLTWKFFKQKRIADQKQQDLANAQMSMQAREEERNRIARELHDDLGATLSGIVMHTHLVNQQLKTNQVAGIGVIMQKIHGSASEMITKLSDIVWLVNPRHDSMDELVQRIEEFAVDIARTQDMDVQFDRTELLEIKLDMQTRKNLYLICKEAINNAVKYSSGSELKIEVIKLDRKLRLVVADNGKGFNTKSAGRGNGLINMRERAESIGAEYDISSEETGGTKISIECRIPQ